jgi:lysophospholipase L1-like esterase
MKMKMRIWKNRPKWFKISLVVLVFLIISECILRFVFGIGDLAIYREDKRYEYFYESNQDVWRYGNHIVTNEFGMRSKSVNKKKKITILEFGDSVLNGGAHVDQDKLATTKQDNQFNDDFNNEVQVLNISAQSWGVSNAFAFLKAHGDFNADIIVLVFSSHDLNDNMHFRKVVGEHPAWPDSKPFLALTDAFTRSLWPSVKRFFTGENEYAYLDDFNDSAINPGWKDFFEYGKKNNIPVLVYLHASKKETKDGQYNEKGKKILKICKNNNIKTITDFDNMKNSPDAYIDEIHLNEKGHDIMFSLIEPVLNNYLKKMFN